MNIIKEFQSPGVVLNIFIPLTDENIDKINTLLQKLIKEEIIC